MIASMFNLDHRLTELRGTIDGPRHPETVGPSPQPARAGLTAAIRSLLGRRPAAGRQTRVAA